MATVVRAMAQPDSGLEIRDRMWLKITIPNAFIGKNHIVYPCSCLGLFMRNVAWINDTFEIDLEIIHLDK